MAGLRLAVAGKWLGPVCSTITGLPLARLPRERSLTNAFASRTQCCLTGLNSAREPSVFRIHASNGFPCLEMAFTCQAVPVVNCSSPSSVALVASCQVLTSDAWLDGEALNFWAPSPHVVGASLCDDLLAHRGTTERSLDLDMKCSLTGVPRRSHP